MRGAHLPGRAWLALLGLGLVGALSLALAYPPERVLGTMFEADQQLETARSYYQAWGTRHPRDYEARLHNAELQLMTARPAEAVATLEAMQRDWPADVGVLERLVEVEDSLLDVDGVRPRLEALSAVRPDDAQVVQRLADHDRWFADTEGLIRTLRRLLAMGDFPEERMELIDVLLANRRYQELIEVFSPTVDKAPDVVQARSALYEAYLRTGRIEEAIGELRELVRLDPQGNLHLRELAERLVELDRWDEALELYKARISADPRRQDLRADLLELYLDAAARLEARGDRAQAVALLRERVALAPTDVTSRLELADLYGKDANKVAIAELKQLLALQPRSSEGWAALGERLSWSNRLGEATSAFAKAVELSGKSEHRRQLAEHLLWTDREAAAIAEYQKLVGREGATPDRAVLAELLLDAERAPEALAQARILVGGAGTPRHRRVLALALVATNDCAGALPQLRELLARTPLDLELWQDRATCATELGLPDEALEAIRQVQRLEGRRAP